MVGWTISRLRSFLADWKEKGSKATAKRRSERLVVHHHPNHRSLPSSIRYIPSAHLPVHPPAASKRAESGSDRWWGMVTSGSLPPSRPAPSLRFPVHPVGRKAEPKLDLWSPAGKDGESVSEEAGEERSGSKRSTSHYHPFLPQPPADQERDIIAAVSGR